MNSRGYDDWPIGWAHGFSPQAIRRCAAITNDFVDPLGNITRAPIRQTAHACSAVFFMANLSLSQLGRCSWFKYCRSVSFLCLFLVHLKRIQKTMIGRLTKMVFDDLSSWAKMHPPPFGSQAATLLPIIIAPHNEQNQPLLFRRALISLRRCCSTLRLWPHSCRSLTFRPECRTNWGEGENPLGNVALWLDQNQNDRS